MDKAHNRRAEDRRAPGALQWSEPTASAAPAGVQPPAPERYGYTITPRAAHLGGGWRLQLLDGNQEAGGGVYPAASQAESDDAYQEALDDGEAWLTSRGERAVDPRFVTGTGCAERRERALLFSSAAPTSTGNPSAAGATKGSITKEAFEEIAEGWDGCDYDMVGDIGAALRRDFERLATQSAKQGADTLDAIKDTAATHGMALVPMHPNGEMVAVMADDEWTWEDLLAAAEAVTEDQYNEIAKAPEASLEQATGAKEGAQPIDWIYSIVRDVSELDRDSPEGEPDMMLVTADELFTIVRRHAPRIDRASTAGAESGAKGGTS